MGPVWVWDACLALRWWPVGPCECRAGGSPGAVVGEGEVQGGDSGHRAESAGLASAAGRPTAEATQGAWAATLSRESPSWHISHRAG